MQDIGVDNYGIEIMLPKAVHHLVRINSLSCIAANILKQEMLSLGAEAALARGALTGKTKKTDCLLMATLSQFKRLAEKLKQQPFGLNRLADDLSGNLANYGKDEFRLDLGRHKLRLTPNKTCIIGIINITPDSFSGDGFFQGLSPTGPREIIPKGTVPERAFDFAEKMVEDGADIIDIGGESSRPGAKPISVKEELSRTIPVIKKIARKIKVPVSIDTYKPEVARQALDCGAAIVNDITGLRNDKMIGVAAKYKAGVVIMHMKGNPRTMQKNPVYKSLLDEVIEYLDKAMHRAVAGGINREKIILDPGIGFGKAFTHNLEILKNLRELKILGRPLLAGVSRKSFLGKILNAEPGMRIFGSVSACILAAKNGANMVRVHDVKALKQALTVLNTINSI
ncbi:MAG: dihydropteroate synthase [Candidatus Omnitrophica bacterium]|nr:dihydropteroate synthase [Candidatus Omnitrophota bacterium]MDD5592608.1 dihydropteroate synthase [Candidatus Omnitrophota bacterium]